MIPLQKEASALRLRKILAFFLILANILTIPALAEVLPLEPHPKGQYAVDLTRDLKTGDSGEGVEAMQRKLSELGYLFGAPSGVYDEATAEAVMAFETHLYDRHQADAIAAALSGSAAPAAPTPVLVDGIADTAVLEELFMVSDGCVWQEMRMGDANSEVVRLQNRLSTLGYLSGELDGAFGNQTRTAVRAFQFAVGLYEDGIADVETQAILFSAKAPKARYAACAPGDSGENVVQLQKLLMRLGFMQATIADGSYGKVTETAVRNAQTYLQKKNVQLGGHVVSADLPALGLPTEDQGVAVTPSEAEKTESAPAEPLKIGGESFVFNGEDPYSINVNGIADSMLIEYLATQDTVSYIGTLKKDDWTDEVTRLQRRLYSLEYTYDKADSIYGGKTEKAVKEFQRRNGLEETGRCDEKTIALLFSDDCRKGLHTYKLIVDVSDQKVYAYTYDENDEYTQLVRKMTCSTGKKATPTPLGTFTNTGRGARWHYFKKFTTWAQYAFYIDGDIMFHSVLYNDDDPDTLIKSSVRNLGKRASHGCVRLAVEDAKWIWNNCDAHITVVVRD